MVLPAVVPLVPATAETIGGSRLIGFGDFSNALIRETFDGRHILLGNQKVELRAWLRQPPRIDAPYVAQLPFDDVFELRAHAARRLWRALSGRPPGPEFRTLPPQRRDRLVDALRALDARLAGATYRTIAEVLFGAERVPASAWKTHDLRNRTIRLVQNGHALMRGGYFDLLRYPLRRR